MHINYSTKKNAATITLTYAEVRQFLSLDMAVEQVRAALRLVMQPAAEDTARHG